MFVGSYVKVKKFFSKSRARRERNSHGNNAAGISRSTGPQFLLVCLSFVFLLEKTSRIHKQPDKIVESLTIPLNVFSESFKAHAITVSFLQGYVGVSWRNCADFILVAVKVKVMNKFRINEIKDFIKK